MWEASFNNTHRAVDMIPKDIVICDWHYERLDKTAVYFAMKGFKVVTCPWRKPSVATEQVGDMVKFRQQATIQMKDRYHGMVQTVWSPVEEFLDGYYGRRKDEQAGENTAWNCFKVMYDSINKL
jgi:hypothetical protein